MIIEDGKGAGKSASVSTVNRLNVSAKANPRSFYISRDDGLAFNLVSVAASIAAGEYLIYFKNISPTRNAYIEQIHFGAANDVLWKAWAVTGTAAGGNPIASVNLNLSSGRVAEETSRGEGSITGLATNGIIDVDRTLSGTHGVMDTKDVLILGPGDAIALEYDTGTTGAAEASLEYHYETIGAT